MRACTTIIWATNEESGVATWLSLQMSGRPGKQTCESDGKCANLPDPTSFETGFSEMSWSLLFLRSGSFTPNKLVFVECYG